MPKRLANVHVGYDLRYTYVKKNTTICKICAALFDNKLRRLCANHWDTELRRFCRTRCDFCQTHRIFTAKGAAVRQKAPQSLYCGALQDGALRHGHQSAALLVGEKRRTCRHVFKCRCDTFVAFFLTYTICTCHGSQVHLFALPLCSLKFTCIHSLWRVASLVV